MRSSCSNDWPNRGVFADAATEEDLNGARQLPGWQDLEALRDRVAKARTARPSAAASLTCRHDSPPSGSRAVAHVRTAPRRRGRAFLDRAVCHQWSRVRRRVTPVSIRRCARAPGDRCRRGVAHHGRSRPRGQCPIPRRHRDGDRCEARRFVGGEHSPGGRYRSDPQAATRLGTAHRDHRVARRIPGGQAD